MLEQLKKLERRAALDREAPKREPTLVMALSNIGTPTPPKLQPEWQKY